MKVQYLTIAKYLSSLKICDAPAVLDIRHYEALRMEIVRLLKEERQKRKLSKYTVSKNTGVSQSMLSLVERGLRNPTLELALRIADGIGVELPAIIKKARTTAKKAGK